MNESGRRSASDGKRPKYLRKAALLFLFTGIAVTIALAWLAYPRFYNLLPVRARQRLPEEVVALLTTPIPTALPAPAKSVSLERSPVAVPAIVPPTRAGVFRTPSPEPSWPTESLPSATPTTAYALTPTAERTRTLTSLPSQVWIEGLEVIPQKFNNCGPANLSVALRYYGVDADQLTIGGLLKPNYYDRNVSPEELAVYVNENTSLTAAAFSGGDLTMLKQLLAAGLPVIIEKGLYPSERQGWMGHYLTLAGFDDDSQVFLAMDTFLGPWDGSAKNESYATVADQWEQFNYTFILVFPEEATADVDLILGPEMLDPALMWSRAARRAQEVIDRQEDNAYAWFNLGSSLTHLAQYGDELRRYEGAAAAFDRARTIGLPWRMLWYQFEAFETYLAVGRYSDVFELTDAALSSEGGRNLEETYYYRAQALAATGELVAAATAYRQALSLNPNLEAAAHGLAELLEG